MRSLSGKGLRLIAVAVIVALACACVSLVGCDSYEPQSSEDEVLRYYQDKYPGKASIKESHALGNYQLFGYSYGGMEYIMSDGASVIYIDGEGVYRDNRQSSEIKEAAAGFVEGKLAEVPGALTPIEVESIGHAVGFETYAGEGPCWHTRYDGDIEAFLQEERPPLSLKGHYSGSGTGEGRFGYSVAYDEAQADGLEDAYLDLSRYVGLDWTTLAVVDRQAFEEYGDGLSLFDEGLRYTLSFKQDPSGSCKGVRFKPAFVKLLDGMTISSSVPGVTLREGDVSFADLGDGFYACRISGEAAAHDGEMTYYLLNDSDVGIVKVNGIDRFDKVCDPHEHLEYRKFYDDATYYIGDLSVVKPRIEIESVTGDKVVARYHTYFKDQISSVSLRVIGSASKDGSGNISTFTSTEFESRIMEETDDGWLCEVTVPEGARKDNTLCFQFTYGNDKDVSVQIEQPIMLP